MISACLSWRNISLYWSSATVALSVIELIRPLSTLGRRISGSRPMPSSRLFQLGRLRRCIRICGDSLDHGEALEAGMAEVERLVVAGVAMGGAERLRFGPGLEILARAPDGMRG